MSESNGQKTERKQRKMPIVKISYESAAMALIWVGVALVVISVLFFLWDAVPSFGGKDVTFQRYGNLGEYIGGIVGSFWSLAGVILFYEALRVQRSELQLQREELQQQRVEIMEQTEQYIIQNQTLLARKLEGTFFQLISLHNEIIASMALHSSRHPDIPLLEKSAEISGRYSFKHFYQYFKLRYAENIDMTGIEASDKQAVLDLISETYRKFFAKFQEDLGHYFRNLFNLIVFIDTSKLPNKKFYFNLTRSQLSNYELLLLFYHSLSPYGKRLKPLLEKYSFFIQFPEMELIDRRHKNYFDKKAFSEEFELSLDE